jgi:hypothetical protein
VAAAPFIDHGSVWVQAHTGGAHFVPVGIGKEILNKDIDGAGRIMPPTLSYRLFPEKLSRSSYDQELPLFDHA